MRDCKSIYARSRRDNIYIEALPIETHTLSLSLSLSLWWSFLAVSCGRPFVPSGFFLSGGFVSYFVVVVARLRFAFQFFILFYAAAWPMAAIRSGGPFRSVTASLCPLMKKKFLFFGLLKKKLAEMVGGGTIRFSEVRASSCRHSRC